MTALAGAARRAGAERASAACLATDADDIEIRALLRARPTRGAIALALTREPHFRRAARADGDRCVTAVLRHEHTGELLGFGTRSVREVFHDGTPIRVGYLGQLRAREGRLGIRRLQAGFALLGAARAPGEAPFDLTAIADDNAPARRVLERGLPGLPRYRELGRVVTLVMETGRTGRTGRTGGAEVRSARREDRPRIAAFLQERLRGRAFAPRWTVERIEASCPGLAPQDFAVVERGGRLVACGACWDQRAFKQVLVAGYARWLGRARPLVNAALRCAGKAVLPPPGSTLDLAYLSHLALADAADADAALALVGHLRGEARRRGLQHLAVAFRSDEPLLEAVARRVPVRRYGSRLYAVLWDEAVACEDLLDGQHLYVEAATL